MGAHRPRRPDRRHGCRRPRRERDRPGRSRRPKGDKGDKGDTPNVRVTCDLSADGRGDRLHDHGDPPGQFVLQGEVLGTAKAARGKTQRFIRHRQGAR